MLKQRINKIIITSVMVPMTITGSDIKTRAMLEKAEMEERLLPLGDVTTTARASTKRIEIPKGRMICKNVC